MTDGRTDGQNCYQYRASAYCADGRLIKGSTLCIVITLRVRITNLSRMTPTNPNRSGPNLIGLGLHMHVVNKGDNVHKILGAIGQMGENEGSDDSGEARFFCAL